MKKVTCLTLVILLIVGCNVYKKINFSAISVGMTKQEVISALKKKPDNIIGAKQYPGGVMEVVKYTRRYDIIETLSDEEYWLYFWNDTLKQWGRPGDWQKEADKVYEIRYR